MDNEIDKKIDVTAILFLLVQNRQQTHDWILIGSGYNGLGIQEWSLFEFNNFSFLIDIIDNVIFTSGSCHKNSNQWQFSIIVTCVSFFIMWPVYCTAIEGVLVTCYEHISNIYPFWYDFNTVLCQLLETGTSDKCLIGIV